MIKRLDKFFMIIISLLLLTGCWDFEDINRKCIVISIGVDYVNDMIELTGEIAKIRASSKKEEGEAQGGEVYNMLSYGKTLEETRLNYDSVNPFPVFLGATRVVVFGTNYAKKGVEPYLNRIDSVYDYRKTLLTVVSREPPKELFEFKIEKDISVGFLIEDILEHLAKRGEALYTNVGELLSDIASGRTCYMMPYIGIEDESIKYLGLAVMKDSKLAHIINIEDSKGILYLLAEKPVLNESIQGGNGKENNYSFRTNAKKRKIKTSYVDEQLKIDIDVNLAAELRYQYYNEQISDDKVKELENKISSKVKNNITLIIKRAQEEFECDIFNFQKHFEVQHPKIYEKIDWERKFVEAEIKVIVETKMINMNLRDPNAKKKF